MGTWGTGTFQNDIALDWAVLLNTHGSELIAPALLAVADQPDDQVSMRQYSEAVAAIGVVAGALGAGDVELLEDVRVWIVQSKYYPDPHIVDLAGRAVQTVLGDSEMKELWMQSRRSEEWLHTMSRLASSLVPGTAAEKTEGPS